MSLIEKLGSEEKHLMLDLETLSLAPDAVITQIGGCVFCPCAEQWEVKSFSFMVDPETCIDAGLDMDWQAIKFWLKQDVEARSKFELPAYSLKDALALLSGANWSEIRGVWSHGACFDIPILQSAYASLGLKEPWSYKIVRDTRTLFSLAKPDWPDNPVKHSAVHDAIAQAGAVVSSLRKLGAAEVRRETI